MPVDPNDVPEAADPPDWLNETCPTWCQSNHRNQDHPDDRRHQHDTAVIPILQPRVLDGSGGDLLDAAELHVATYRGIGAHETWVAIATDQQHLELTLESAHRLRWALRILPGLTQQETA